MYGKIIVWCFCSLCLLSACEIKEKPIQLPPRGDGKVMQVDMGENYEWQYFINLSQQKVVHISRVDSWDLAFQNGEQEYGVFLNGGKLMAAHRTSKLTFADVSLADTLEAKNNWRYDAPDGVIDSTAIGNWKSNNPVYIIRLNESGSKLRKIQFLQVDPFQYTVAIGDISSNVPWIMQIPKDPKTNFTYFSFEKLDLVKQVEPEKTSWDLQVTRYHYTFYEETPPLHYLVNGFLLNPYLTTAYKDSLNNYSTLDASFLQGLPLSDNRNTIGFDWKVYDINKGIYTIVNKYNFIVKDQHEAFFKLRFLDFYNSDGIKGSPKFEYLQID